MKLSVFLLCTALLSTFVPQNVNAESSAKKITVYADGAVVRESVNCNAEKGKITLYLPLSMSTASFSMNASPFKISETFVRKVKGEKLVNAQSLKADLEKLENKLYELNSQKQLLDARINFWKNPRVKIEDVTKASAFENHLAERLEKLNSELSPLIKQIKELKKDIALLKKRMQDQGSVQECYEVSAWLTDSEQKYVNGKVNVALSYELKDCGWSTYLTLDARPKEKSIRYEHAAIVQQKTGLDWENAELTLSTTPYGRQLTPRKVTPWIIQSAEENTLNQKDGLMLTGAVMFDSEEAPRQEKNTAAGKMTMPAFSEQSVSGIWTIGLRTIPAGIPIRITLDQKVWQADFVRLIRPSQQKEAFLNAHVKLPSAISISRDNTAFLVEGVPIGTKKFSFVGDKGDISFGSDPAVTAEMKDQKQQKSKTGFVGKKQIYEWHWNIEVKNAHQLPVKVRIEDPAPQSRDQDIIVKVISDPKGIIDKDIVSWEFDVPASSNKAVSHSVSMEAPASLKIKRGR